MFFAINSKTKQKVNSLTIETDPSYQFIQEDIWYADYDEIENCPKEIDIKKIKVIFRKGTLDIINWKGTKYDIAPHFFIPNKTKLKINTIPESKEHKLVKNWIYNKLKQNKLILKYSEINKPYKYFNQINLFDLPIDKEKIGIEVTSSLGKFGKRRADVICPFLIKHPIFGKGIIFEIQFSKQIEKSKISRELDWSIRGYSIAWLFKEDFNQISELIIDLKKDYVEVNSFANLIKQNNKSFVRDLKSVVQEECRKLDCKKKEIIDTIHNLKLEKLDFNKEEIKFLMTKSLNEIKNNFQPTCPNCGNLMILKKGLTYFWGCFNYPNCKITMSYHE